MYNKPLPSFQGIRIRYRELATQLADLKELSDIRHISIVRDRLPDEIPSATPSHRLFTVVRNGRDVTDDWDEVVDADSDDDESWRPRIHGAIYVPITLTIFLSAVAGAVGKQALDIAGHLIEEYLKKKQSTVDEIAIYDSSGHVLKRIERWR
jgi:hypothetical protein